MSSFLFLLIPTFFKDARNDSLLVESSKAHLVSQNTHTHAHTHRHTHTHTHYHVPTLTPTPIHTHPHNHTHYHVPTLTPTPIYTHPPAQPHTHLVSENTYSAHHAFTHLHSRYIHIQVHRRTCKHVVRPILKVAVPLWLQYLSSERAIDLQQYRTKLHIRAMEDAY